MTRGDGCQQPQPVDLYRPLKDAARCRASWIYSEAQGLAYQRGEVVGEDIQRAWEVVDLPL